MGLIKSSWGRVDGGPTTDNFLTTGAASAQHTLIEQGAHYVLIAVSADCTAEEGSNPTAVFGANGIYCPVGVPIGPMKLNGAKVAAITAGGAGKLCFIRVFPHEGR